MKRLFSFGGLVALSTLIGFAVSSGIMMDLADGPVTDPETLKTISEIMEAASEPQLTGRTALLQLMARSTTEQTVLDKAALKELARNTIQHRRTVGGYLCASTFSFEKQVFTDCTTTKNPAGVSGTEWCYVNPDVMGQVPGGFQSCAPVVDYNLVYEARNVKAVQMLQTASKYLKDLQVYVKVMSNLLNVYDSTCGTDHALLGQQLSLVDKKLFDGGRGMEQMEMESTHAAELQTQLDTLMTSVNNMPVQTKSNVANPYDCTTSASDSTIPDGLTVEYYSNPTFSGDAAVTRVESSINFNFYPGGNTPDIPLSSFSLKARGYIVAPATGNYFISVDASCGSRVFVNNKLVYVSGMSESAHDYLIPQDFVLKKRQPKNISVGLSAGTPAEILIEVFHASHLKFTEADSARVQLLWSKDDRSAQKQIVESQYLYTKKVSW